MPELIAEGPILSSTPGDTENNRLVKYGRDRLRARLERFLGQLADRTGDAEPAHWLMLFSSASTAAQRDVVAHPYFQFWWVRLMGLARRSDNDAVLRWSSHFPRFLVPILLLSKGVLVEKSLLVRAAADGTIRFPGMIGHVDARVPGATWLLRRDGDDRIVFVRSDGDDGFVTVAVSALQGEGHDSRVVQRAVIPGSRIEIDASDPWVMERIHALNAEPPEHPYPKRDLTPQSAIGVRTIQIYSDALKTIDAVWPALAREMEDDVKVVVPFESKLMLGWAELLLLGAVFVRADTSDLLFIIERLAHEASHVRLFLISHVPLHTNRRDELMTSPFRRDPRPASGLYHAAFVYARLIDLLYRIADYGHDAYHRRAAEMVPKFWETHDVLRRKVALTEAGSRLLDDLATRVVRRCTK